VRVDAEAESLAADPQGLRNHRRKQLTERGLIEVRESHLEGHQDLWIIVALISHGAR
jgi:hypothetical protein